MEKITLIIPIYNVEKYLEECLNSIVNQTFKDFKCVLVNDGATDGSAQIIEVYREKYPEIFTVITKENGGLSDARNAAIRMLDTEYVVFLDSDDIACPDFLKVLYETIEREKVDIVECGFIKFYEDGKEFIDLPVLNGKTDLAKEPEKMCSFTALAWNKIYKSCLFLENDILYPKGLIFEDTATTPRLLARSSAVYSVKEPLVRYRQRAGSIMNTLDNRIFHLIDISELLLKDKALSCFKEIQQAFVISKMQSLIMKLSVVKGNNGKQREAFDYLNKNVPNWKKNKVWNSFSKNNIKAKIFQIIFKSERVFLLNLISGRRRKN